MRTYIFTRKEKQTIINFLVGSIPRSDPHLMVILSRLKTFKDLSSDIDFSTRLRKAVTTNSTNETLT